VSALRVSLYATRTACALRPAGLAQRRCDGRWPCWRSCLVLASAAAVAAVVWAVAAVPVSLAFVLRAVLSSTDPVAVSALGRRLSLPAKVQALVQGESLFNDATSLVLFQIAVSFAVAGTAGTSMAGAVLRGAGQFAVLAAGGAAAGGVIAAVLIRCAAASPTRCWKPCSR